VVTGISSSQKFTLKERDNETGLDFFEARYYASTQGRFTSVDPEQAGARNDDPQSWNGYAYARNSPLVYSDPDGRKYTVCDSQGKNCVDYKDSEFDRLREGGPRDGYTFNNGNIYYNGELTATYSNDCLYCEQLVNGMAQRAPAMQKAILAFGAMNLLPAAGIVGSMTVAGGGLTTLGTLGRAAPAAGAGGTVLNQLSRTDVSIFQRAAQLGASAQNTFLNNRNILADATFQENPTFKLNIIGKIGNSPVWGSIPSRVGIAEVNGVTVIVKMVRGNPQILGPLP
jgi:RHS repeat-associated protein